MSKKLKIKFWKAEKALAMQVVEQWGLPERKTFGRVQSGTCPMLYEGVIGIRGCHKKDDWFIGSILFDSNGDRDAYLDKMTQSITDELFTGKGELKVGEMCEVRDFEYEDWQTRKLLAILPNNYIIRFIVKMDEVKDDWVDFRQARPLAKRTEPKVEENGEIITYTWEEK
jgi:hypothetical protein